MRIALVLGSGGARGYAHIGVIEELKSRGHEIVTIAGTSMGALVGGLEASGGLPAFTEWATSLTRLAVIRRLDFTVSGAGMVKADRIIDEINSYSGNVRIEDLPIPFTAVASDVTAQREVWFQRGPLDSAIRASIAIPGFITPVRMHGHTLVDGGVCNPVPIEPTLSVRSDVTVAVSLAGRPFLVDQPEPAPVEVAAEHGVFAKLTGGVEEISESVKAMSLRFFRDSRSVNADDIEQVAVEDEADPADSAHVPTPRDAQTSAVASHSGLLSHAGEVDAMEASDSVIETGGKSISTTALLMDSLGTMQGMIERYRAAANPAQINITVPYASASTLDFNKAPELIELGRQLAKEAFDRAGI